MIEEPYRWVEAIANRREYIEHQLVAGSPITALAYQAGVLMLTLGQEHRKLFEVYDRIAMGAIGHPGDIERLRMTAIDVASTEGFTRSSGDVSLRRLANYSLSPVLKAAFEQVYGAPFLARLLFVELASGGNAHTFLRLDYDGSIRAAGSSLAGQPRAFGVIAGNSVSSNRMEKYLQEQKLPASSLRAACDLAVDAWTVGHMAPGDEPNTLPSRALISAHRTDQLSLLTIEAAVLDLESPRPAAWRVLAEKEIRELLGHPK